MDTKPMVNPIHRILVANRGEIACRVIASAKARGIFSVAIYSDADRGAPHVRLADQAIQIGPARASESYLNIEKIVKAAQQSGAEAIHPGYGFLSENAAFRDACDAAGITFIGPKAHAIHLMGDKAEARRHVAHHNVPLIPGFDEPGHDDARLTEEAERIGFPLMVKASAGGGGRGMRRVETPEGLSEALTRARDEAMGAFGDDALILERALDNVRHVEIQVLADAHGNCVALGERDCSVQRRHQKVIEEAPSPAVDEDLRNRMGEAAVRAAKSVDYVGAGTVEFLLDHQENFYFLEMNTRLQVEHPVTEMVTGLDLVDLQIAIAEGAPLPFTQDDVVIQGHAIEVRLYAEDPAAGYLPQSGPIELWSPPVAAPGVRVDDGIESGQILPADYDAMVAKIVAHGPTRDRARARLIAALGETHLIGPSHNLAFLSDCLAHDGFARGTATTGFLAEAFPDGWRRRDPSRAEWSLAAALSYAVDAQTAYHAAVGVSASLLGWASHGVLNTPYVLRSLHAGEGDVMRFGVRAAGASNQEEGWHIQVEDRENTCDVSVEALVDPNKAFCFTAIIDGIRCGGVAWRHKPGGLTLSIYGVTHVFEDADVAGGKSGNAALETEIKAPMHGEVREVSVGEGATVATGDVLAVVEAMKMQHPLTALGAARVEAVMSKPGDQVRAGQLLMTLTPVEGEER
ncbi:MAG: biotin carboxylase N-terminal domain-containing protein [Pseudomonadota bacterium]